MPRAAWIGATALGAAVGAAGMVMTGSRDPWSWTFAIVALASAAPFHLRYLLRRAPEGEGS